MLRKIIILILFLWLLWFILMASFNPVSLLVGLFVVLLVIYFSVYFFKDHDKDESVILADLNFNKLKKFFKYGFLSLIEIVSANIDVAERVLDPRLPIKPSIVKIKVPFKNNSFLFTLFVNTITLTPGTLTLDYEGEYIYVHFLAEEHIESLSQRQLDKKIMEIFDIHPD
ncbi:Na+/H+ antiporter subunit E [Candidatus Desantisbacteria bacterium]|nr:Na+/H+ antiporter subunit E [Candidatus Desantisbacteria bacterium]